MRTSLKLLVRGGLLPLILLFVAACEAPLDLSGVEAEAAKTVVRFDMFQAAAHHDQRVVVVASNGVALVSDDNGNNWRRDNIETSPSLIDVTACESGDFFALDSTRAVWRLAADGTPWSSTVVDTPENTLSISCAPGNRL